MIIKWLRKLSDFLFPMEEQAFSIILKVNASVDKEYFTAVLDVIYTNSKECGGFYYAKMNPETTLYQFKEGNLLFLKGLQRGQNKYIFYPCHADGKINIKAGVIKTIII
jgi:hypothetical protein